jgi:TATA-box binding protein (TBP) (component of TFIID and TFIIIB)
VLFRSVKESKLILHLDEVLIGLAKTQIMHGLFYVGCSRVQDPEQLIILYKSNRNIVDGLNSLCRANEAVFEFIEYTEETMHQILNGTYVHAPEVAEPTIVDVEVVSVDDKLLFSSETHMTRTNPALNPVRDVSNPFNQVADMFNNQ